MCDLIEASRPPGLFRTLDDVCRTVHAGDQATMDKNFMERVVQMVFFFFFDVFSSWASL